MGGTLQRGWAERQFTKISAISQPLLALLAGWQGLGPPTSTALIMLSGTPLPDSHLGHPPGQKGRDWHLVGPWNGWEKPSLCCCCRQPLLWVLPSASSVQLVLPQLSLSDFSGGPGGRTGH